MILGVCHFPVDFRAHSRTYPRSLPLTPAPIRVHSRSLPHLSALTPAHSRTYPYSLPLTPAPIHAHSRSLLQVLMHDDLRENDKSLILFFLPNTIGLIGDFYMLLSSWIPFQFQKLSLSFPMLLVAVYTHYRRWEHHALKISQLIQGSKCRCLIFLPADERNNVAVNPSGWRYRQFVFFWTLRNRSSNYLPSTAKMLSYLSSAKWILSNKQQENIRKSIITILILNSDS